MTVLERTPAPVVVPDLHGRSDLLDVVLGAFPGRSLVFLGDLVDRGPDSPGVLTRVRALALAGRATLLLGNHDHMLAHALIGEDGSARALGEALPRIWDVTTVTQWPTLEAVQRDMAWLLQNAAHWHRWGQVYLSHAAPHLPHSGTWGAETSPSHLWTRPDDELRDGRAPIPLGCTLAVHGHTPTRMLRPDGQDLPLLLTWPDGTQAAYLDTLAWHSGTLATLDLADLSVQLHTLTGPLPAPRLPPLQHVGARA